MPAEAVIRALRHVWLSLEPLDVPVAVMGGLALATWKYVRATRDVDLLVHFGENDTGEVLQRLRAADIRPKRDPPVTKLGQLDVVQLLYEPPESFLDLQIDLFLATSEYHLGALERRTAVCLPDVDIEIAVLTCEDLILHKLLSGRVIDRADAAGLLRANRESLELEYLTQWVGRLKLGAELREVWKDAFPEEELPGATASPQGL